MPSVEPQRPGQFVGGRYRLVRRLGAGASAYVWIAHDDRLDRDVAVKILRATGEAGGAEQQRLRREAHALAHLNHPGITAVYDLVEDADPAEGALALVTELLTGEDLAARLRRGALGLDETLRLCAQVADALDAAHRAGVIHRDVKPANVMLTANGVKLLDFGIARTEAESELTGPSAIGTPACMAPEQWLGKTPEPATDVYALGCLLYWCLAGQAPFAQRVLPALAVAHLEAAPPALPDRGQDARIDALYRACVAKDPADRPTATAVAAALDPARRAAPPAPAPVPAARRPSRWRSGSARSRAAVIVTGGSLCLAGAIGVPLAASSSAAQPVSSSTVTHPTPRSTTSSTPAGSASKSTASSSPRHSSKPAVPPPAAGDAGDKASHTQPVPPGLAKKPGKTPPGHVSGR
ncbi:serine/threonine-protein kinase [Actinospica robiniae]|uniref:serine/threonine-protein kinase n=1 Tax=Actinospica robiniae TaxID=304901 RepID=UPI000429958C|nr:serine/threonine-protein kinase [Actinospica robiniae]